MPALSLEEFAIVLAHVTHYPTADTERVLAKLQVTMGSFCDAAAAHPLAISESLSAGGGDAAQRFQARYDQTAKALAESKPDVDSLPPLRAGASSLETSMDVTIDAPAATPISALPPFKPGPAMHLPPPAIRMPGEGGDTAGLEAPPGDATPFQQPDLSHWAVETYASFTAERRFLDADAARVRYGLRDGADEYALMVHFNRRFAREPGLRERWTELVQRRARELSRGS
ncbi:MAG: hypothetical protein JNK04_14615 [Myxococcales bacterium]|nr:hypothetical protein [Myxococcales bacterium]